MPGLKIHNVYVERLGALYAVTPKAVLAAIAISALTGGGDRLEVAQERLIAEWAALHTAGIIPQEVPPAWRALVETDSAEEGGA